MNTDIRISIGFKNHTKTKKLKRKLGADGVLSLIYLWTYTGQHKYKTGLLSDMDAIDIAEESGWKGDPELFVRTLVEVGFLDRTGSGEYQIHDWEIHNQWATEADLRVEKALKAVKATRRYQQAHDQPEPDNGKSDNPQDEPLDNLPDNQRDNPLSLPLLSLPFLSSPFHSLKNEEIKELSNFANLTAYLLHHYKFFKEVNELFPVTEFPSPKHGVKKRIEFFIKNHEALEEIDNAGGDVPSLMPALREARTNKNNGWYSSFKNIGCQWLLNQNNTNGDQSWWEVLQAKQMYDDYEDYQNPIIVTYEQDNNHET